MFPNPRASSPNAAEEKTRAPQTTSTKTRSARGLSTCDARFFMVQLGSRAYSLYGNYRNDHAGARCAGVFFRRIFLKELVRYLMQLLRQEARRLWARPRYPLLHPNCLS